MGASPAPRQPAWSLVSSPMAPSSFPSLFQIGIRAVRAKLSQPWTAPSLRSLHPLAERPCCVPPACNAHLPACVLLRSAHWRLLGVRQNAQQVARCSSPPVRSPLPSSRVVALVLAAQPHPRRCKSSLVVDAALHALPVRRNAEPCGQPMRLVTTHSGPTDDDRATDVVPTTRCSWWTT
ncbi:uncharacterized protein [Zea mays]|uniref:uncharacterized protein n=1 Tax=Zea mays TaxID=4577 RepID=UPI0009AABFA5|nr:uncharacterized protein LOC103638510 [Zea mays]|eukprot:XP_020399923.1 uncharacterized protein LOC103638510 [Zea mays]